MVTRPFESKIQDIVYNVDVGLGLRLIKLGLYVLFLLSIMALYTATQFRGLRDASAMDMAQLGRNLALNGRYMTQVIRPASMWYLIEHSPGQNPQMREHPDIVNPPVYPALLSLGFRGLQGAFADDKSTRIYPPEQWVVVPINLMFSLLTGLMIYLLAFRMFDVRVATLSMSLFFLSDATWGLAITGTGVSVAVAWCAVAFYLAVVTATPRPEGRAAWPVWLALAGCALFSALAVLTRYGTVVLVPALALYLGWSAKQRKGWIVAAYVGLVLVILAPWLARNYLVSGGLLGLAPYTALNGMDPVLNNDFERTLAQNLKWGEVLTALQVKFLGGLASLYSGEVRTLGDGLVGAFFLTTFFYSFARDSARRLRWCVALGMVCLLVVAALFGKPTALLFNLFWPLVLLYGTAFFYILLDRMQIRVPLLRMAVTGAFVGLTALPLVLTLLPPRAGVPYPPYYPPYISHVSRMLTPDELLCTDMPWATAWYGQRTSLLLPATLDEFYEINDYTRRVSGLYFTTITRDRSYVNALLAGPYRTWFPIMEGRIPADFPLSVGFPLGNFDQLFLTDRQRW
jgi:hypothetical protein